MCGDRGLGRAISGQRVRDIYPAKNPERVSARVDDRFLAALVSQVTAGFGGKVTLAPRLFLRELVDVMDRVDLHEDYVPGEHYKLQLDDAKLTPEELAAKHGRSPDTTDVTEDVEEEDDSPPPKPTRRLDG